MGRQGRMLLGIVAALFVAGTLLFFWRRDPLRLPEDAEKSRMIVLQHVPPGTHTPAARRVMERSGFQCVIEEGFYVDEETPSYPWTRQLYCWKSKWGWIGAREWQVFLFLNSEDIVQDVYVTYGITAPCGAMKTDGHEAMCLHPRVFSPLSTGLVRG